MDAWNTGMIFEYEGNYKQKYGRLTLSVQRQKDSKDYKGIHPIDLNFWNLYI